MLASLVFGQTFEVDQQNGTNSPRDQKKDQKQGQSSKADSATPSLGWGSSIEVARQAPSSGRRPEKRRQLGRHHIRRTGRKGSSTKCRPVVSAGICGANRWTLSGFCRRLLARDCRTVRTPPRGWRSGRDLCKDGPRRRSPATVVESRRRESKRCRSTAACRRTFLGTDPQMALDLLRRAAAMQSSPRTDLLLAGHTSGLGVRGSQAISGSR